MMKPLVLTAVLMFVAAACSKANGTEPSPESLEASIAQEAVTVEETTTTVVAQADPAVEVYPDDRYPGMAFVLLTPEERVTFVELAEAELCPCAGQISSLDTCLLSRETGCSLAASVGALMMRMIKEDADGPEISDAVQRHVQSARQVYEFDLSETPAMGGEDAPVSVVVFSDFQCPHCRALAPIMEGLTESYGGASAALREAVPPQQSSRVVCAGGGGAGGTPARSVLGFQ